MSPRIDQAGGGNPTGSSIPAMGVWPQRRMRGVDNDKAGAYAVHVTLCLCGYWGGLSHVVSVDRGATVPLALRLVHVSFSEAVSFPIVISVHFNLS